MGIGDEFQEGLTNVQSAIGENPLISAGIAAGAGAILGATTAGIFMAKIGKRKKKTKIKAKKGKKKTSKRSKKGRKLKFGSKAYRKKYLGKHARKKQKQPYTAGKRKDTSHRRIRYTKNNQPYIILPNGRARFIKRSSAHRARKLKGGRY